MYNYLLWSRPYWQWAARLMSVLSHWRPWEQMPEATHTTTPWLCLTFYQLSSRNPTWQLKTKTASVRMVRAALFLPSVVTVKYLCSHWCSPPLRHSGAETHWSCGSYIQWQQCGPDSGSCHVQWGGCCLLCGCAKGQLFIEGPWTSQGEKCWLHVSSLCYRPLCI